MSTPFLSEIKIVSFNFPPKGWAFCNGQLLPINQNQALFSLLGTTYGGDGVTTFALPDLRGRVPMHMGNGHSLGEKAGQQNHSLLLSELAAHNHPLNAGGKTADTGVPTSNYLASIPTFAAYAAAPPNTATAPSSTTSAGGGQPHTNEAPYLTLSFIIALQGIFPSQN